MLKGLIALDLDGDLRAERDLRQKLIGGDVDVDMAVLEHIGAILDHLALKARQLLRSDRRLDREGHVRTDLILGLRAFGRKLHDALLDGDLTVVDGKDDIVLVFDDAQEHFAARHVVIARADGDVKAAVAFQRNGKDIAVFIEFQNVLRGKVDVDMTVLEHVGAVFDHRAFKGRLVLVADLGFDGEHNVRTDLILGGGVFRSELHETLLHGDLAVVDGKDDIVLVLDDTQEHFAARHVVIACADGDVEASEAAQIDIDDLAVVIDLQDLRGGDVDVDMAVLEHIGAVFDHLAGQLALCEDRRQCRQDHTDGKKQGKDAGYFLHIPFSFTIIIRVFAQAHYTPVFVPCPYTSA